MNTIILVCWFIFTNGQAKPDTVYKDENSCQVARQYVKNSVCVKAEFTVRDNNPLLQ